MGRHRWASGSETSSSGHAAADGTDAGTAGPWPRTGPRIRLRIAAGAAVIAAGAALGIGIARVAGADLNRGAAQIVASIPLERGTAATGSSAHPSAGTGAAAPRGQELPAGGMAPGTLPSAATGQASRPAVLVVHVAGAVARPGIVRLAAGARVFEALAAAGGAAGNADQSALNLAAPVSDGQQIFVPSPDHPPPDPAPGAAPGAAEDVPAAGTGAPAAGTDRVNINTATVDQLQALPRIGPVLAQRIVEFRQQHGPFARPEDLDAVPGIGPGLLEAMLDLVAV
jgi:competence protein ComEA